MRAQTRPFHTPTEGKDLVDENMQIPDSPEEAVILEYQNQFDLFADSRETFRDLA